MRLYNLYYPNSYNKNLHNKTSRLSKNIYFKLHKKQINSNILTKTSLIKKHTEIHKKYNVYKLKYKLRGQWSDPKTLSWITTSHTLSINRSETMK